MGLGLLDIGSRPRVHGIVVKKQVGVDLMESIEEISHGDGSIVEAAAWRNFMRGVICDQAVEGG